jgi:hypothetical protein
MRSDPFVALHIAVQAGVSQSGDISFLLRNKNFSAFSRSVEGHVAQHRFHWLATSVTLQRPSDERPG